MKVSEVQLQNVAEYLRSDESEAELLQTLINVAKTYIKSYTGLTTLQLDEHDDFVIVIYILCQDMYDNRVLYVEKNNLNRTVTTILDMHCINLLPTPDEVI